LAPAWKKHNISMYDKLKKWQGFGLAKLIMFIMYCTYLSPIGLFYFVKTTVKWNTRYLQP
jgi:hypothetical protein